MKFVALATMLIITSTARATAPEIDCRTARIDALYGAERSRAGASLPEALKDLENSLRNVDAEFIKAKRKPTNATAKAQAKLSFTDGYLRARENPDEPVKMIAGKIGFACFVEKSK